ncbi:MAG: hypothetical protein PHU91_00115 [Candidatus Omnitrophica bacterium]|nr:hypothetical protein [Candidatus Omnitrophota bacterium]
MIHKELLRLKEEGSFLSIKKGNRSYFYINKSYPLFDELKNIVRKTIGIEGIIEDALKKIEGIESAYIYGSFVKNKANLANEINLFIIGKLREDVLSKELDCVRKFAKRKISYNLYTKDEFNRKIEKDSSILNFIKSPKIPLKNENGAYCDNNAANFTYKSLRAGHV